MVLGFVGSFNFPGVIFQYLSAKWVRLAWSKPVGILFSKNNSQETVEKAIEVSFWATHIAFMVGIGLAIWFFVNFEFCPN